MVPGALIRTVRPCWEGSGKNVMTNQCGLPCLEKVDGYVSEAHCFNVRMGVRDGAAMGEKSLFDFERL